MTLDADVTAAVLGTSMKVPKQKQDIIPDMYILLSITNYSKLPYTDKVHGLVSEAPRYEKKNVLTSDYFTPVMFPQHAFYK